MPSDDNLKSPKPKPSRLPFIMRSQAMGSSGWEGYTIGFTLVGCIVAGAGAGYFLDAHFKTNYWLPILFLVGVVGGFREMLVVLKRIQSQQEQNRRDKIAATPKAAPPTQVETELPAERKRIFQVPPPPFEESHADSSIEAHDEEDVDDILKRLLDEADDDAQNDKPKA